EATATNTAVAGTVQPIVSDLNARARNGDTYRTLVRASGARGRRTSRRCRGRCRAVRRRTWVRTRRRSGWRPARWP
ncbi:DUF1942 domain-containing protein, partial [Mycobacterium pyrenivorans]|nr:DUF1942 domain-containing protein [Mycolicibacterium pyrenivorans]